MADILWGVAQDFGGNSIPGIVEIDISDNSFTVTPITGLSIDDVVVDQSHIFLHDATADTIVRYDKNFTNPLVLGTGFTNSFSSSMCENGDFIYAAHFPSVSRSVWRMKKDGTEIVNLGRGPGDLLQQPRSMVCDDNNLFVFDGTLQQIIKFDKDMTNPVVLVSSTQNAFGMEIIGTELFYVRRFPDELRKMDKADGMNNTLIDSASIIRQSLAFDGTKIWIGSSTSDLIWSILPNGTGFTTEFAFDVIRNPTVGNVVSPVLNKVVSATLCR